jgi:hypothetical protein
VGPSAFERRRRDVATTISLGRFQGYCPTGEARQPARLRRPAGLVPANPHRTRQPARPVGLAPANPHVPVGLAPANPHVPAGLAPANPHVPAGLAPANPHVPGRQLADIAQGRSSGVVRSLREWPGNRAWVEGLMVLA